MKAPQHHSCHPNTRLEAIASRLEAIAIRSEAMAVRFLKVCGDELSQVKGRQETTAVYEVMGHDTLEGAGALTPAQTPTPAAAFGKSLPASPRNDDSPPISPAQMIGKPNALTLPIPSSGRERKKGPPKFLPPETHSPSLLNPISRSPRRGNIPDVIGRQTSLSPERTTPGAIGDRTNRTYCGGGTSTAASASYYPSPSPESAGSEEGRGLRACILMLTSKVPGVCDRLFVFLLRFLNRF